MDSELREARARQCEDLAKEIFALMEDSPLPAFMAKWHNPMRGKHWFIPTDFTDREWTNTNIGRIITDEMLRAEMLKSSFSPNNFDSYCHAPETYGHNVHFINIAYNTKPEMLEVMLHEMMHGLRRDNDQPNTIVEELATDTFAILAMKKLGYDTHSIFQQLFNRFENAEHNTLFPFRQLPHMYPSLAFVPEIEHLAQSVNSATSLTKIYQITDNFVQACHPNKLKAWEKFNRSAERMLREGESIPTIIKEASTCRHDEQVRHIGMTLFWMMPFTERTRIKPPSCNAFVDEETFQQAHRKAQIDAFDAALSEAQRQKSAKPFLESAAVQLGNLWQGRSFGYAADCLSFIARNWHSSMSPADAKQQFLRYLDNPKHDSILDIEQIAKIYICSPYRDSKDYKDWSPYERGRYEVKRVSNAMPDHLVSLVQIPFYKIYEDAPDLLPDPLSNHPENYKPFRIIR